MIFFDNFHYNSLQFADIVGFRVKKIIVLIDNCSVKCLVMCLYSSDIIVEYRRFF